MCQLEQLLARVRGSVARGLRRGERTAALPSAAVEEAYLVVEWANGTESAAAAATAAAWLFWCRGDREPAGQLFAQLLPRMPAEFRDRFIDHLGGLPPDDDTPPVWLRLEIVTRELSRAAWKDYRERNSLDDLDRAVMFGYAACTSCTRPDDLPERIAFASNALRVMFELTGHPDALSEAVVLGRSALTEGSTDPRHYSNLGDALTARFRHLGDIDDINHAIAAYRSALRGASDSEVVAAASSGLAAALQLGASAGASVDPHEIIMLFRTAVDLLAEDSQDRLVAQNNLGAALHARLGAGDLDDAISLLRTVATADHPRRAMGATNFGHALLTRHALAGWPADVEEAVTALRLAVELSPDGHPALANCLNCLAQALLQRSPPDQHGAEQAWARAAALKTAPAPVRMATGNARGEWAALHGRWTDATAGYASAAGLLRRAAIGLGRGSQERILGAWSGLARDAAACSAADRAPGEAVVLLEQGRGVLASAVLDSRADLSPLRLVRPDLAERLEQIRTVLDHAPGV